MSKSEKSSRKSEKVVEKPEKEQLKARNKGEKENECIKKGFMIKSVNAFKQKKSDI